MKAAAEQPRDPAGPGRNSGPERIVGIDPGLQGTGYAVINAAANIDDCKVLEAGVIHLNPRQSIEQRLVELEQSLDELITAHRPTLLACEQLYAHYKHPRTAILMAHARGVILALAARRGLAIVNVAATHMKKFLTGNGRASKAQIQRAVAATLHLPQVPEPHDVADALAIALCGLRMRDAELQEACRITGARR